ncbi:MAG TPA: hypothetical protein VHC97_04965 [Thermoanaerobaculia bacterium]|jgi:hypothetical protein|nr:hypothetical protein [Thermoanaerobaculia bacterium]
MMRESQGAGCMLLFFLAIGIGIFLFGAAGTWGPYKEGLRGNNDPRFFLAMMGFGAVFALVALRMLQVVLNSMYQKVRPRGSRERPWESDHPWRPDGQGPDYAGNSGGFLLGLVAFLGLLGLFNLVFTSPSPWLLRGIVLLLDLLGLLFLLDALRRAWQALRHGRPRMRWTTFPAFLGDHLEGVFQIRPALRPNGPVKATLRCVEDAGGGGQPGTMEPFAIYQQVRELDAGGDVLRELPVSFHLPSDLPGTHLHRTRATYWQVFLQVPVTGPDFETVFLAPVYEREEA